MEDCCVSDCAADVVGVNDEQDCYNDCDDYAAACRAGAWDGPGVYDCVWTYCDDIRTPCVEDCDVDQECEDDCDADYDACLPYETCVETKENCDARCDGDTDCEGKCTEDYDICECASDEDECLAACNPTEKAREDFTVGDDNCEAACRMCLGYCYGGDLDECNSGCTTTHTTDYAACADADCGLEVNNAL